MDDTEDAILVVRDYLEYFGYRIVAAMNGEEDIRQAQHTHPSLILMDIQMSALDGLKATQKLRGEAEFRDVPIVALAALAMKGGREECLAAGMNDYISKPVYLKELARLLQGFLSENKSTQVAYGTLK